MEAAQKQGAVSTSKSSSPAVRAAHPQNRESEGSLRRTPVDRHTANRPGAEPDRAFVTDDLLGEAAQFLDRMVIVRA